MDEERKRYLREMAADRAIIRRMAREQTGAMLGGTPMCPHGFPLLRFDGTENTNCPRCHPGEEPPC